MDPAQSKVPEATVTTNEAINASAAEVPKTPPAEAPPAKDPAQAAAPAAMSAPAVITATERTPTRKLIGDSDDEIPDNTDLLEMSPRGLKGRLERFTKKQLKERFGVDDFDAIKLKLEELETYKQEKEAARLAQMTELDRLKEQITQEQQARVKAETHARDLQESRIIEAEDRRVMTIASKYIDPDYIENEIPRLARYLYGCSEEELRNADTLIDEWFKKRIEDKPKLGKDYGAQAANPAALPPPAAKQVPLSNGADVQKPNSAQPSGAAMQKTAAPGKANSMSEAEVREFKRAHNLNW